MFTKPMSIHVTLCLFLLLNFLTRALAVPTGKDDIKIGPDHAECPYNPKQVELPRCTSYSQCLTRPPPNSELVAVVLGVGTQNYTCSSSTEKPTPIGALATLYDITYLAGIYPNAAHRLSRIVMEAGKPTGGLGYPKIGEHYFAPNAKTAIFELFTPRRLKFVGGKVEAISAPPDALKGSVDWLRLGIKDGSDKECHGVKHVYRVYTAGGKPPPTCGSIRGHLTVNYATEYWLYN